MSHAIYVRTSTADQDGAAQLRTLHRAAATRGWAAPHEFVDIGQSGAKARRPALDELRRAAREGEIDALMIVGLDRLGRSLRDLLDLIEELRAAGVALISLREGIDLTTPAGRFFVQVVGALAEFERELIRERVRAGMANARARGRRLGRRLARHAPDPATVLRLRGQKRSWRTIAIELGCTPSGARRAALRNNAQP